MSDFLFSAAETRQLEQRFIADAGLSAEALMQEAGAAAWRALRLRWPAVAVLGVVCGPGNNGGDGWVLARLAHVAGLQVRCVLIGALNSLSATALAAKAEFEAAGGQLETDLAGIIHDSDLLVDALFGIGLQRALSGEFFHAVAALNASGKPVLSLDVPSGLDADRGQVLGIAVRASMTVSFIVPKRGLYTAEGPDHGGQLVLADLGLPAEWIADLQPQVRLLAVAPEARLQQRPQASHKGSYGTALVIGGAEGMPGAALLAGKAALAIGAGRVLVATHPRHAAAVAASCPELMVYPVVDIDDLSGLLQACTVVAVGPGLGVSAWSQDLLAAALESGKPLIVDADALSLLAGMPHSRPDWLLTPHPGEAARLLGISTAEVQADRFAAVVALQARYGGHCVLKGNGSLIVSPQGMIDLVARGGPALAIPGSGDVLTGLLLGLLAQEQDFAAAAQQAVWLHAVLGEWLADGADRGLLASDLITGATHYVQTLC